jgi:hypothetical protein
MVDNIGWLLTDVSMKAMEKKSVRGIICEIEFLDSATLEPAFPRQG